MATDTNRKGQLPDGFVSIPDATRMLEFKYANYVRRLLLEGKLAGSKFAYEGFSKWGVSIESIAAYKAKARSGGDRGRRYIMWMDVADEAKARAALEAAGITFNLEFAYTPAEGDAPAEAPLPKGTLETIAVGPAPAETPAEAPSA